MVTTLEVAALLVVIGALVGAARIVRRVEPFVVNAAVGLLVLWLAEALVGFEVAVTPVALVIVALGGVPGAVVVLLLAALGAGFV